MTQAGKALKPDKAALLETIKVKRTGSVFKRNLRLYWPFAKSVIQSLMSYRINFYMFFLGELMGVFVVYYLWRAIFHSTVKHTLAGFALKDMIVYVFMSEITARIIRTNTDTFVGSEVRDGSIAMNLIKPVNYHLRLLFNALGGGINQLVTVGIPLWLGLIAVRYFTIGEMPPHITRILMYIASVCLSFLILFLLDFCFGMLAFYTTSVWGIRLSKQALIIFLSGQLIPLAFFPLWAQRIMQFIPFSSINYTPVMIYLGKVTEIKAMQGIGLQVMWVVIMFIISRLAWNKAIRRLTILGG